MYTLTQAFDVETLSKHFAMVQLETEVLSTLEWVALTARLVCIGMFVPVNCILYRQIIITMFKLWAQSFDGEHHFLALGMVKCQ